jgi:ribosome maturation factor RimP
MIQTQIEEYIKPVLEDMGYELWGCQYLTQGRRTLLRIYIDSPDGIGIQDCEQASLRISSVLDVEDPISGDYSLEVSSPGIPRPLFYAEQYQRYLGCQVEIKLTRTFEGRKKYTGCISMADTDNLVLNIDEEKITFPFSSIAKANLIS